MVVVKVDEEVMTVVVGGGDVYVCVSVCVCVCVCVCACRHTDRIQNPSSATQQRVMART